MIGRTKLRIPINVQTFSFSTSRYSRIGVKERLGKLVKGDLSVLEPTPKLKIRDPNEKLTNNQALKLLQTKINNINGKYKTNITDIAEIDVNKIKEISPASPDQLMLLMNKDRRLLYNFLGTSADQLKDSYVVERDTLKFLKRNDVHKAIYLGRLAGVQGVVSFNRILEHLLKNERISAALALFQDMKKWRCFPNSQTYTIIFHGCSRKEQLLTENQITSIKKIFTSLEESNRTKINIRHINSALEALSHTNNQFHAWELFNRITDGEFKGIKPDGATRFIMFKALGQLQDQSTAIEKANKIWKTTVDEYNQLSESKKNRVKIFDTSNVISYARIHLNDLEIKENINRSLEILYSWYNIRPDLRELFLPKDQIEINPLCNNKKYSGFPLGLSAVDTILHIFIISNRYQEAVDFFTQFEGVNKFSILELDINIYNKYLQCLVKLQDYKKISQLLKSLLKDPEKPDPNIRSIIYAFKGFQNLNDMKEGFEEIEKIRLKYLPILTPKFPEYGNLSILYSYINAINGKTLTTENSQTVLTIIKKAMEPYGALDIKTIPSKYGAINTSIAKKMKYIMLQGIKLCPTNKEGSYQNGKLKKELSSRCDELSKKFKLKHFTQTSDNELKKA